MEAAQHRLDPADQRFGLRGHLRAIVSIALHWSISVHGVNPVPSHQAGDDDGGYGRPHSEKGQDGRKVVAGKLDGFGEQRQSGGDQGRAGNQGRRFASNVDQPDLREEKEPNCHLHGHRLPFEEG
ncbi:hypothetical protein [Magnetospirillum sp. 15-1]|uniref:hypothetical protein n=1 Tax=Magnetospirillum sp. 15-1 TaxID=1979370 RepID=UPI001F5B6BA7|nr:hypothetical protein [Magnetospirillum sp. 15-1]